MVLTLEQGLKDSSKAGRGEGAGREVEEAPPTKAQRLWKGRVTVGKITFRGLGVSNIYTRSPV